jgi:hypothetical protein
VQQLAVTSQKKSQKCIVNNYRLFDFLIWKQEPQQAYACEDPLGLTLWFKL